MSHRPFRFLSQALGLAGFSDAQLHRISHRRLFSSMMTLIDGGAGVGRGRRFVCVYVFISGGGSHRGSELALPATQGRVPRWLCFWGASATAPRSLRL